MNVRKLSITTAVGMAGLLLGSAHAADAPVIAVCDEDAAVRPYGNADRGI